jgi:hypothetical protein
MMLNTNNIPQRQKMLVQVKKLRPCQHLRGLKMDYSPPLMNSSKST